ncbi:MAG: radical SAM protein [Muribaculaceae bacterium]
MQTVIFHETVFGPIHSRRLGISLGINLMPNDGKICSFDCVYCEAGYNAQGQGTTGVPTRHDVHYRLNTRLKEMHEKGEKLDVITFSGNGEPTLHPEFKEIVNDVLRLRNKYFPEAKVSVLSNSTMITKKSVIEALRSVDNNILKLDSAISHTLRLINQPKSINVQADGLIEDLKTFAGNCIIQTMMLRGSHDGKRIDNTTDEEIDALIAAYSAIKPREVMLYSIDRKTPEEQLEKVSKEELESIARRIEAAGINVQVNA